MIDQRKIIKWTLLFLIFGFIWIVFHEFLHHATLELMSYNAVYEIEYYGLRFGVKCLDCQSATINQQLLYISMPYIFGILILFVICILSLKIKNKYLNLLSIIIYSDLIINIIFGLISSKDDIISIFGLGHGWLAYLLFLAYTLTFAFINRAFILKNNNL